MWNDPTTLGKPRQEDLVRRMCLLSRWAGDTIVPWTVGHHVLLVHQLAPEKNPLARVDALLHDVEEAYVGDVQYTYKTEDQAQVGRDIRDFLFRTVWDLPPMDAARRKAVKRPDKEAACIEARVLLHPLRCKEVLAEANWTPPDDSEGIKLVWTIMRWNLFRVEEEILNKLALLLATPQVKALKGRY